MAEPVRPRADRHPARVHLRQHEPSRYDRRPQYVVGGRRRPPVPDIIALSGTTSGNGIVGTLPNALRCIFRGLAHGWLARSGPLSAAP